jgi:flagellar biosynthetic protein FliS
MKAMEQAYRKTALQGASGFGLLIALYDTLAGNLRRAADAERSNNIEERCKEVNHALLVTAHLEDWVHRGGGGKLAEQLLAFYASLRRLMIEAQAKRSAEVLEQQMILVLSIRRTWYELEVRSSSRPESPAWAQVQPFPGSAPQHNERSALSWSA